MRALLMVAILTVSFSALADNHGKATKAKGKGKAKAAAAAPAEPKTQGDKCAGKMGEELTKCQAETEKK